MTAPTRAGHDDLATGHRLYDELADWWPLLSPASDYVGEAEDLLPRLRWTANADSPTLLELGAGGGSLAFHLTPYFRLTLTDLSPGMQANSRTLNPEAEHVLGDMRTLRLDREFDVVLIHDAIMYLTTPDDVRAALRTAAMHCRAGGCVAVLPDYVRETYVPSTEKGGEDAPDGRGLRYLAWSWDPDPSDNSYIVDYAFLLREADGTVRSATDRHVEGLFARDEWLRWFAEVGLEARSEIDAYGRDIFIATPKI